jgi:hypothetical protein
VPLEQELVLVLILYVYGGKSQILNIDGTQIFPPVGVSDNLNVTSGVSTFYDINVTNNGIFDQKIGIGNQIHQERFILEILLLMM